MIKRVRSRGYYPYLTNPDEISELEKDPDKVHQDLFAGSLEGRPAVDGSCR